MYVIDAREGASGDMLLAAMIGLLGERRREEVTRKLKTAAATLGIDLDVRWTEDSGDRGLAISYRRAVDCATGIVRREALGRLDALGASLGSSSAVPRSILERIFDAEARAHGVGKEDVHVHEVGRPEALFNMAAIGYLSDCLDEQFGDFQPADLHFTQVVTGSGTVRTSHGTAGVPAPATSYVLNGLKHSPGDCQGERATPVGVAALRTLASKQVDAPTGSVLARSVGFGTRRFAGRLGRMIIVRT